MNETKESISDSILHNVLLEELNKAVLPKDEHETELDYMLRRFNSLVANVRTQASRRRGMIFEYEHAEALVASYYRSFLGREICSKIKIPGDQNRMSIFIFH